MQLFRVSFSNQIGAFVVQLTNWLVLPLRKVIPGVFGLDLSSLLPAYLLQVIVLFAAVALQAGPDVPVVVILFGALRALLRTSIYLLIGLQRICKKINTVYCENKGYSIYCPLKIFSLEVNRMM